MQIDDIEGNSNTHPEFLKQTKQNQKVFQLPVMKPPHRGKQRVHADSLFVCWTDGSLEVINDSATQLVVEHRFFLSLEFLRKWLVIDRL